MINTLHKSLTIAFMAASIFISGLTVDLAGAQNTALGPVVSRRPADLLRSQYIRFDRLNYRDGLTKACRLFWIETILAAFRADEHTVGPQATDLPTASIRQPRRPSPPSSP